jgi:hypothetical protein
MGWARGFRLFPAAFGGSERLFLPRQGFRQRRKCADERPTVPPHPNLIPSAAGVVYALSDAG